MTITLTIKTPAIVKTFLGCFTDTGARLKSLWRRICGKKACVLVCKHGRKWYVKTAVAGAPEFSDLSEDISTHKQAIALARTWAQMLRDMGYNVRAYDTTKATAKRKAAA